VIGGSGGNIVTTAGPIREKPDKYLSSEALLLRKLKRAMGVENGRPVVVLQWQQQFPEGE
jgi:hypothetical protein